MFELCIYWVYDASPSWYLIFVDWRKKPTYVGFCSLGAIYVGVLSFDSWRDRIFRGAVAFSIPSFFSIENPRP